LWGTGKEIWSIGSKPQENRWNRSFMGYRVLEVKGLKELLFDYRSHEVSSVDGSYEHISHPISGAMWLTGGLTTNAKRKVEAGDTWRTHIT
jgi:hypothetical protein